MSNKPLAGITVVDVSSYVTGGFASSMLANQGADVVKIERPDTGDPNRESGPPFVGTESGYFMTVNYGKKSIEIDLKSERGRKIVYQLVEEADVFIENFRPGTADRLSIGYDDLRAQNEQLVYCSLSAFGLSGPLSDQPGFDVIIQGRSGIMDVTGHPGGPPTKVGLPFSDVITAMWAAFGILNALYRRERTGEGDFLDIAMFDAVMPLLTKQAGKVFEGETPERLGTRDPVIAPYQAYETADGHLIVGTATDKLFQQFCTAIERPDLQDDPRFQSNADRVDNVDALEEEIEATLTERPTSEWLDVLIEDHELPVGPVWGVEDAVESEQLDERGVFQSLEHTKIGDYPVIEHPINYENAEAGFDKHAPALGESTEEVLAALGMSPELVDELAEEEVIGD